MSNHLISHRERKFEAHKHAALSLALGLALVAFVLAASLQPGAAAMPDKKALATFPVITLPYAIFASGPSAVGRSVYLTGAINNALQIIDGGIYAGDGGSLQNIVVTGTIPPPIDIVGGCTGPCTISGNASVNFNAAPQSTPQLYDVSDFAPGGVYATEAAATGHYYPLSSLSATGTLNPGLYYVTGDVTVHDVTGNVSIVTTGDIQINGSATLTTYDQRFPLLFTTSSNISNGAIRSPNSDLDLTGNLYAPNGLINIPGTIGSLSGLIYAKEIKLQSSLMTVICPVCNISTLYFRKSVTPTTNVPYHGVVTYTIALHNTDVVSDTSALVTDTLPTGVTFGQWLEQPADGVIQNSDAITWTGVVSASAGITFTFTATHTGNYGDAITNIAYLSSSVLTGSADATFFVTPIYTLTVGTAGNGSGVVTPTVGAHQFIYGAVVDLQATAGTGSTFTGWSGDVDCADSSVTIDADKFCIATFVTHRTYLPIVFK